MPGPVFCDALRWVDRSMELSGSPEGARGSHLPILVADTINEVSA